MTTEADSEFQKYLQCWRGERLSSIVLSHVVTPLSSSQMSSSTRPIVFMDINIGETPAGRLKMELFSDIVPKSVAQGLLFKTHKHS